MKKFTESAQDYFDRHPSSNECHITSDGRVFHEKGNATSFANTLDNQDIESFSRKVLEKEKSLSEEIVNVKNDKVLEVTINTLIPTKEQVAEQVKQVLENGAADREAKIKELEALELVTANYNEMKALVKFFDLKVENQKAETLITALTEFKNTLNQQ
ncbi:hypothetical protein NZ698_00500 [Chryseobacterium sp. PBS4-4]|uniref:Uncharacterized protein n=1 Tax=Chryseobacterium edaphi TaxID=2976532 RepID=A0ABT2W0Z6_9FLAO|nr:hypothetical protein [Chryseobacterium edaphi]MCU7615660.1 hypothetical protein [Chryseobacterium edaphi]